MGYAGNNYLPFLLPLFHNYRKLCLDVIEFLHPTSTTIDTTLEQAIAFVLRHRQTWAERLPVTGSDPNQEETLDLSWVPLCWRKAVTGRHRRDVPILSGDRKDYVTTTFCYGCYLGPTQTSRSIKDLDRFQVAYVNQRHITEQKLLDANISVINHYNRFMLPKLWGSGQHASADGMKWDVYEQNLLSEYHICYGGWGGIGYYHVSDS